MGSGLAKNLIKNGHETSGFDLSKTRMNAFLAMGGLAESSPAAVGEDAEAVFIMVMNGDQAKSVIFGSSGLAATLGEETAIIVTATITAREVREIAADLAGTGIHLIDSPVSGGYSGAQSGRLTLMAAAPAATLERYRPILNAVGETIHHVGEEPGMGQSVKACLQSLIAPMFTATFEATVLAAKAGIDADVVYKVFSTSGAGCNITNYAIEQIVDGRFEGTGSQIRTMHKDISIAMDFARELGVPLFTAAASMQLFQAGTTRYPDGDNWAVARITEEIACASLRRKGVDK